MINFTGDAITIEEMPQGCVIASMNGENEITITSLKDATAVVESLLRMIDIKYSEGDSPL